MTVTFFLDWTLQYENVATMDDLVLLKNYAQSGSEEAFRELVTRHLATVYWAARRQAGDSLAPDVTQAVFVLLAKKAPSLGPKILLVAWLLKTTRLVSRATIRSEVRRQRWEKEAATMPMNYEQTEVKSAWEQVQPLLDDALADLPEKDRGLIALRFFQQKSHAEIAVALGLNEDASKKRLSRALERLRNFFSKRGVTLGAAILLATLSQNAAQATPNELISHITTAATTGVGNPTVAALVKTSLKIMTWIKMKIIAATTAAVLVVAGVPVVVAISQADSRVVKTDGREAKLESYEFTTNTVHYRFPMKPTAYEEYSTPEFSGEPLLRAALSWQVNSKYPAAGALRVAAADELGNEFDPVVQEMVNGVDQDAGRQFFLLEAPVFPRRGKEVHLRVLANNGKFLAEFKIPNPAPGPYPNWVPDILPVHATNGDLEVLLTEFRTFHRPSKTNLKEPRFSRTDCVFRFQENGTATAAWAPVMLELADATGNHWMPSRVSGGNPYRASEEGGAIRTELLGALWPGETAWKIRGEFQRAANFPANELLRIPRIRIPDSDQISEPLTQYECNGAMVELEGVIGTNAGASVHNPNYNTGTREQRMRKAGLSNSETRKGCITIALGGEILSRNRRLAFAGATDEQGHTFDLVTSGGPTRIKETKYPIFYSYTLRPPEGAHEINLVLAVPETRTVEFIAAPEHVQE